MALSFFDGRSARLPFFLSRCRNNTVLSVLLLETVITEQSPRRSERLNTVLHVRTAVGAGGGADKTTLKSPNYLRGSSYRAAAAYLRGDTDLEFSEIRDRAKQWRCPLIEISDHGAFDISVAVKLYILCRRLNVRVWHAHEYKSNVIGLIVGRLLGLKLVSTVHGWVELSPKLNFFYKLDHWALRHFDRVVVVSQDLYEHCSARGVDRAHLRLIQNGIEVEQYQRRRNPQEARRQFARAEVSNAASPRLVIGTLGRLAGEKGFAYLIEAFARLCGEGKDIELWIAGDGNEQSALEAQAVRHGIADRVKFLGHVTDTVELYECFDIFCLPSLREGLPNVLLEALAMTVPAVATTVGGISSVLDDGANSRLVPPGSADALHDALCDLIENPGLRDRLAAAGRQLVEREFDFRARMNKMIAVYDELFEGEGRTDDCTSGKV